MVAPWMGNTSPSDVYQSASEPTITCTSSLRVKGTPLAIDADGCRVLPEGPGLGVEMDWDWIEDHTLEVIRTGETPA